MRAPHFVLMRSDRSEEAVADEQEGPLNKTESSMGSVLSLLYKDHSNSGFFF